MQEKLWDAEQPTAELGRRVRLYCEVDQGLTDEELGRHLLGDNTDIEVFLDADGVYFYDQGVCFLTLALLTS